MFKGLVLLSLFSSVLSLPKYSRDASSLDNCIGKSTKVISRAMLQGYADTERNLVFSPLGYSSLLAMLAEGSNGETENEISEKLHLHKESVKQRNEFRDILSSIKVSEKYTTNKPQLRTWFYVYKNYSVDESYKRILTDYYLTNVKNVYPTEFEVITKSNDVIAEENNDEDMERYSLAEDSGNSAYDEKRIIKQAEKEDESFKTGELIPDGNLNHHVDSEMASGVEVEKKSNLKGETTPSQSNPNIHEDEAQSNHDTEYQNGAEQVVDTLRTKEKITEYNIQTLHDKTSLGIDPVNFIPETLKKRGRKAEHNLESLMIIFNGYYFEADWAIPFDKNATVCSFHLNETEQVNASSIKTRGVFKTGEITYLNSSAISIPFQGGRYSLIIILPNECNGLGQLISDLNDTSIQEVLDMLEERELEVQIPQFTLESTTDPGPSLSEIGVTSVFSETADLSGISETGGLHTQEIVQLVTMKITRNIGTVNYMTAMSVTGRSIKDKFIANHPFLFFIEDHTFNVTVVAGKIINPTLTTV
ncbi:serpin B5-like [Hetaerina americana]|uniref:serpin B5-like n=1 Tax=Hetaerina americana TaxID=62018 RepID=UPI003A7F4FAB